MTDPSYATRPHGQGRCLGPWKAGLIALGLSWLPAAQSIAETPQPPAFYAIENVRVAVGNGDVLERATVLVSDGLIEAVAADAEVPGDAWIIDGEGLTVYPGLIDPLTSLGLKEMEDSSDDDDDRGDDGPAPVLGPETRPATHPYREAADHLDPDAEFSSWREAGFTSALTVPDDGFFNGRAGLIHLGEGDAKDRVLARSVAQHMGLKPVRGFRNFPNSLMGVLSYVDQVFMDTRYHMRVAASYEKNPLGQARPRWEAGLEALADDLQRGRPFLVPAVTPLQIDRALAMADKHDFNAIIYGGHGAYARLDELAKAKVPVLMSLDWPEAEKDRDPEADSDFRVLYHRRMLPNAPKRLVDAGVPFAFYSAGLGDPSEYFDKVRAAVKAGLPEEQALRAMTLAPAEILGVERILGTVERGKVANLVLASAAPWAEDVEIRGVFVDGRYFFERQESEQDLEPPAGDVSGTWALKLKTPRGTRDFEAMLNMDEEGKVTGELKSERGDSKVEKGRLSADRLTFESTRGSGSRSINTSYSLLLEGETLDGTMSAGPMTMDVSGERTQKADKTADQGEENEEPGAEPDVTLAELEEVMAIYQGPAEEMDDFAITDAKIYTVSGEVIDSGTVVVSGGKIQAVGADVSAPEGYRVIDAHGGSLIPGIIDAHSHIAVDGSVNEGSLAVTSMVTIADVVDPTDISIYRALAGGVTTINVLHGSANPIGGGNAVLKLRWGQRADGVMFEGAPAGIKFALGENPKRSSSAGRSGPRRYPATRMGVMDVIRQAFTDARAYQKEWQSYRAAVADSSSKKRSKKGASAGEPMPPRKDRKLEALVEILEGRRLVHSHCYRADEILQLMLLADEFGFKVATLQHVLEGYKVADEIAAHGAGASTFSDWWGYKMEAYDAIPHNAALMTERGVLVSINSDSGEEMRHLNHEAAKAMRWGNMSHGEALKLVTLNPAIQLGIDDRVGSIEVGKDADLVLYDGDPLSARSVVQKTFVDGDLYFDLEHDRERQAAIDGIKERLNTSDGQDTEEKEGDGEGSAEPSEPKVTPMPYSCHAFEGGH